MVRSVPGTGHGNIFVVTESHSDKIAFVDLSNEVQPVQSETVVGGSPWALAIDEKSKIAYVSTAEGLAVVDLTTRERTALVPYRDQPSTIEYGEYRSGGSGVVVTPDGSTVCVGVFREGKNSSVELFDVAKGEFTASFEVGLRPFDVQMSPSGDDVYTIDHDSFTLHTINLRQRTVTQAEIAPFGVEGGLMSHYKPHYAAVADDGSLFMPYQGRALAVYSPTTGQYRTEPMEGDTHQHGVCLTADGRLLVVGVGEVGGATRGPSLTIRTVATGEEKIVPLDKGHENPVEWLDAPDGRPKAILTGGSTSRGPWDGLTIVDLESHTIVEIEVPNRPQMGVLTTIG